MKPPRWAHGAARKPCQAHVAHLASGSAVHATLLSPTLTTVGDRRWLGRYGAGYLPLRTPVDLHRAAHCSASAEPLSDELKCSERATRQLDRAFTRVRPYPTLQHR